MGDEILRHAENGMRETLALDTRFTFVLYVYYIRKFFIFRKPFALR